jgi:hypothetical protein
LTFRSFTFRSAPEIVHRRLELGLYAVNHTVDPGNILVGRRRFRVFLGSVWQWQRRQPNDPTESGRGHQGSLEERNGAGREKAQLDNSRQERGSGEHNGREYIHDLFYDRVGDLRRVELLVYLNWRL